MVTRGRQTQGLWLALWVSWFAYMAQIALEGWSFNAPVQLLVIQLLPLVLFMPGVARDSLRSLIWLCFILLGYFVLAVMAAFAQPDSATALAGVALNVLLFTFAMFYIRQRGREIKASQAVGAEENGTTQSTAAGGPEER